MSMRAYFCAAVLAFVPALSLAAPASSTDRAVALRPSHVGFDVCQAGRESERERELEEPDAPQRNLEIGDDQRGQDDLEQGDDRQRQLEAPDDRQQGLDTPGDDDNDDD